MSAAASFRTILSILNSRQVEYVVIGGFASYVHGSGILTRDIDIVHRREPANVRRLMDALLEMKAAYRTRPELVPNESHLMSTGHQLLLTEYGRLDILGAAASEDYETLAPQSEPVDLGLGVTARIVHLATIIRLKEQAGREKDLAALPVLRALLRRSQR